MNSKKLIGLLFPPAAWITLALASLNANPSGNWSGAIVLPNGAELAIAVELATTDAVDWTGQISIPAQGIRGFSLSKVEVDGNAVGFAMEGIPGSPTFLGQLSDDRERIAGEFSQGGQKLRFSLGRSTGSDEETKSEQLVPEKGIPGEGVIGEWVGALRTGPMSLRLALRVRRSASGMLEGEMDSLDQNVMGLPLSGATVREGAFAFEIKRINGRYEGKLSGDGSEIDGTWTQHGSTFELKLLRVEKAAKIERPQEPKGPLPYEEREVAFRNEEDGIQLSGTLVIPHGKRPFPAVVFVSGSGPQDRDESLAGHRPFLVLADALARCGIASLRYDDRGHGKSEGDHYGSTTFDFAEDALAAVRFLETVGEVDAGWVGIVGHSEGGLIGPIAAEMDDAIDFLILLAPPAERLDALLLRQRVAMMKQLGIENAWVQRLAEDVEKEMALVLDRSLTNQQLKERLQALWEETVDTYDPKVREALGFSEATFEASVAAVSTNWFRALMRIDPAKYLESLTVPTLALLGEKDVQVDAKVNGPLIEAALAKAGNEDFTVKELAGLNHLFQNADTGSVVEYGQIEETFDPEAMAMICEWIRGRK